MGKKLYNIKGIAVAIGLGAILAGCSKKLPEPVKTDIVTETPDDKENAIDSLRSLGIILEQETSYKDYYKIIKSSTNAVSNNIDSSSSINDYFEEKNIVPYYDAKCSPMELAELMHNASVGIEDFTYGNIPLGSTISYNDNLKNETGHKYFEQIMTIIYDYIANDPSIPKEILAYNLLNSKIKEVYEDKEYYSRFDPVEHCIYINKKYVDTKEKESNALLYAIVCASLDAYIDVDNKTVYCSLTNFYYDSKNDKLLEVGSTYRDYLVYYKLYLNNKNFNLPLSQEKQLFGFCVMADFLKTDSEIANLFTDFSTYLEKTVSNHQIQFPSESEEFDIAEILINADKDDKEALKKAIDYYKATVNYGTVSVIQQAAPWITNLNSLRDELIEYSNKSEKTR